MLRWLAGATEVEAEGRLEMGVHQIHSISNFWFLCGGGGVVRFT